MDHTEALRLQAAEKYVLGELPPQLRDEYEEHYFDCQECATDLKAAVAFASGTRSICRSILQEETPQRISFNALVHRFLRPAWTVPVMALLLVALTYQTFVIVPERNGVPPASIGSASFVSLIGSNSRGEGPAKSFAIHRHQPVVLELDITSPRPFPSYLCQIQDTSGRVVHAVSVSATEAKHSVHLIVSSEALQARTYALRIMGQVASTESQPVEVAKFAFTVEFLP